jgi:transposase
MMGAVYESYLGIDVGKKGHRACAIDRAGRVLFNVPVPNSERGLDDILSRAGGGCLVVVDQKRNIGLLAIRRARLMGLEVAYLPGAAMSRAAALFPGDAKTDERDAEVIARTALGIPGALRGVPPEDSRTEKLRRLSAQRADLLAERTHQKNRVRALLLESNPEFEALLDLGKGWMLSLLATFGGPWDILDAGKRRFRAWMGKAPYASVEDCEAIWGALESATRVTEGQIEAEGHLLRSLASRIAAANGEIEALSSMMEAGLKGDAVYEALLTVPGVGPKTAAQLVLSVAISDFRDHDALASYAGLAPKNRQSGTSISSVTGSKQGNRPLKNLLIYSCTSLIGRDNYYGRYYGACRARGMRHNQALKAVARKRLKVIFAVMRDARPYTA